MSHFRFCVTFPPAGNEGVIDSGSGMEMTTYYWMLRPCFSVYDGYTNLVDFIHSLDVKKLKAENALLSKDKFYASSHMYN